MNDHFTQQRIRTFLIVTTVAVVTFLFLVFMDTFAHNVYMVVNRLGIHDTPYKDFALGFLLFIALTMVFVILKDRDYLYLWFVKAFVTLIVMIPYEMYYGLDAYMYFSEAVHYSSGYVGGKSGTTNVVELNHLFTYFVGDSYYSLKLLNSFISFIGIIFLHQSYITIMKRSHCSLENDKFIYVLFLFPSILFWSSILGKDPLNLFFVGLFIYGFVRFMTKKRFYVLVLIGIAIIGVRYIRTWWSVIMILSIVLYYINFRSYKRNIILLPFLPIFYLIFSYFLQSQGISSFDEMFYRMSYTSYVLNRGGSAVGFTMIHNIWEYMFYYLPNLFTTLFRPMPWDIRNPFSLLAAIENMFLLYFSYKYIYKNWRQVFRNKYLRFLIMFIFSWSLFYVIISPTNLGMSVRFKLQVLPAMLIVIWVSRYIYLNKMKQKRAIQDDEQHFTSIGQRSKRDGNEIKD